MTATYLDRNALAVQPALPFVAAGALVYTPGKPQFSALAADTLGNLGTPADGFDSIFSAVASIVDGDIAGLSVFDTILGDVGFVTGALDAVIFSPIAKQYEAFAKVGDAALGEHDSATQPPPGKKPPPPPKCGPGQKCLPEPPPPCTEPPCPPGNTKPPQNPLCKRRFPYGYMPDCGPSCGDPCTPG